MLTMKCGLQSIEPIEDAEFAVVRQMMCIMTCNCMRLCVGRLQIHKSEFIHMLEVCGETATCLTLM